MGRNKIAYVLLPTETKIKTTYNKRIVGLQNKARELGLLCGCEVALLVFPPKECNSNEVTALSVNGTVVDIFHRYLSQPPLMQQQNPRREQQQFFPQQQQPPEANMEPSSSNPQPQQPDKGKMKMDDYAPKITQDPQLVFPNMNEQVPMQQQMQRYAHPNNMQGMPHSHLQHSPNLLHHIPQQGNHFPLHPNNHILIQHNNHLPPQQFGHGTHLPPQQSGHGNHLPPQQIGHGNHLPPQQLGHGNQIPTQQGHGNHLSHQQGHGANYMAMATNQSRPNQLQQQNNNMTGMLYQQFQASAPARVQHNEVGAVMPHAPAIENGAPPRQSPDSDDTIDNAQFLERFPSLE